MILNKHTYYEKNKELRGPEISLLPFKTTEMLICIRMTFRKEEFRE